MIFVKYREVSTPTIYQILPAIAETALYSRFGGGIGKREKEEAYVRFLLAPFAIKRGRMRVAGRAGPF